LNAPAVIQKDNTYYFRSIIYISGRLMLVCRLPKDGGVPPKHVAVNKNCIVKYIGCAFVGFTK